MIRIRTGSDGAVNGGTGLILLERNPGRDNTAFELSAVHDGYRLLSCRLFRECIGGYPINMDLSKPEIIGHGSADVSLDSSEKPMRDAEKSLDTVVRRSPEEIKGYNGTKRICMLVGIGLSLVYWLIWLFLAPGFVNWLDQHLDARWFALFVAAFVFYGGNIIFSLPLDYYSGFVVERRYKLSNQTPKTWLVFQMKGWLVGVVIGAILLGGLYALLWYSGPLWSLWVWLGFMLFAVGLSKVYPLVILPLFYPATPLDRPTLNERLRNLAGEAGMTITGIFNLGLSEETKKANAMLAGLGSTRRAYLSDTLLNAFTDNQIAVVFAHELGHHIRGHIIKSIAMAAVVSSLLVALIHWRLNPYAGGDPGDWTGSVIGLAQVGLIMSIFPLVIGPITNAISRYFERQADSDALRLTNDPDAYRSAFQLLTDMNLADPNPPRWEEILFDDHPALAKRIAMADHYQQT